MPQAQWPLQLQDGCRPRRAGLRQPQDLSGQGRRRQSADSDRVMAMAGMVIIGAGECGGRAALARRDLGFKGSVTLVGDKPHLPYERPPLSKEAMTGDAPAIKAIAGDELLAERSIRHIRSVRATAIDRAAHQVQL